MSSLDRRRFLHASAAVGSSLLATGIGRPAAAATRIEVPAVDRIVVQEVTDGAHDVFLRGSEQPGLAVQRTGSNAATGKTLHSEWGLALHIESPKGRGSTSLSVGFWLHPRGLCQQPGDHEDRPGASRCADPQPRAFRPLRRTDRFPRGAPRAYAQGPTPLYRRGGYLLPSPRPVPGRQFYRSSRARPPPAEGAERRDGAVGHPCGHRGPRLYNRGGAAHEHRASIAEQLGRSRHQGWSGVRRQRLYEPSFHGRGTGWQTAARPALA